MDASEKHVAEHLHNCGFTDVVYEPDGNIPPDFLVNGTVAIEVRRLNQNDFSGPESRGLEEVAIPLWNKIKKLLDTLGPPVGGASWFVHFRFRRPVEDWRSLEPKLRAALSGFRVSSTPSRGIIARAEGIELEVISKTSTPRATMFVMSGCVDQDSGGWLLAIMETNIHYCSSEKARKIAKVRPKYPTWWLALVDHIGFGLDDFDRELFRDQITIEHPWDRIILIDPRDPKRWFEI